MWIYIIKLIWLFLPAGLANMAPVIFRRIDFLNYPVDGGRLWQGKRIFGSHKTWRGLFFGFVSALVFIYIQKWLAPYMPSFTMVDYQANNIWLLGLLLATGALFGDLIRSFFKRRVDIVPGESWPPFDQLDWIIGSLFFISFYIKLSWDMWLVSLALALILHPAFNYLGYLLKFKKKKL